MSLRNVSRTRQDVSISYHRFTEGCPMVNVKAYNFPSAFKIESHFNCEEKEAEQAGQYAFEMGQQSFWEDVQDAAGEIFGSGVKVHSAGRCSGYATVEGLDEVEKWDAIALSKWRKFEKWCIREVHWLCSTEKVFEDIEANRWVEQGAEAYNFADLPSGETICISEMKAKAAQAGFGPVIRK